MTKFQLPHVLCPSRDVEWTLSQLRLPLLNKTAPERPETASAAGILQSSTPSTSPVELADLPKDFNYSLVIPAARPPPRLCHSSIR